MRWKLRCSVIKLIRRCSDFLILLSSEFIYEILCILMGQLTKFLDFFEDILHVLLLSLFIFCDDLFATLNFIDGFEKFFYNKVAYLLSLLILIDDALKLCSFLIDDVDILTPLFDWRCWFLLESFISLAAIRRGFMRLSMGPMLLTCCLDTYLLSCSSFA